MNITCRADKTPFEHERINQRLCRLLVSKAPLIRAKPKPAILQGAHSIYGSSIPNETLIQCLNEIEERIASSNSPPTR